jgi:protease-4
LRIAQAQEIREAVLRFRSRGKFAYAWSESYGGDLGPGTSPYYLASAFDQVFVQPSGAVQLTGFMLETYFVKGTLDKLGAKVRGDKRAEYKSGFNEYTETKYTAADKEENTAVLQSICGQVVRGIAEARHLPESEVRALIDRAPLTPQQAQEAKLVDGVKYRDEVYDLAKKQAGEGSDTIYLERYLERAGRPHRSGKIIALIFGVGSIMRGASGYDPLFQEVSMGSDTVAGALRTAADDKDVKAILFRIDSPGGSYLASDVVWREVVQARKNGKPVIVSMGDLAGSGGYFVAMAADKIVAQPGTITASIGVYSGKVLTADTWKKIGITWDEVHAGQNATFYTSSADYSPAQWQLFETGLDRVYDDFTTKVAEGRHLPKEKVLQIAKGRIWTGEDAKNLGLVDELGGFPEALSLVKKVAGIPEGNEINLKVFPAKKPFWQVLFGEEPENSDQEATAGVLAKTLQELQPIARQLRVLRGASREVLSMPEFVSR